MNGDAGAAVYSAFLLRWIYDTWVLGISSSYAWRCSTRESMLPFFHKNLSEIHLDIGVGTGYYLAHSPVGQGSVTLADLNINSIAEAHQRVSKQHPRASIEDVQVDVLAPLAENSRLSQKARSLGLYRSISCFFLLHCIPGPPQRKAQALAEMSRLLRPDGVLYGTTILGRDVQHNLFGRSLMNIYNSLGIFDNWDDSIKNIIEPLKQHFDSVDWRVQGCVLFFEASKRRESN